MAISFNNIPSNIRVPLFYGEIDNSQANVVGQMSWNALLCGQMLDGGTAEELTPIAVTQASQANSAFGRGSQLARMVTAFRNNCPTGQLYCIPVKPQGGTKAQGRVNFKGTASESGYINLYIGQDRVRVTVTSKADPSAIAQDVINAVNAQGDLPVTAAKATSGAEATSGKLIGGKLDDNALTTLKGVSDGSVNFYIDGETISASGIDLSSAADLNAVATVLSGKLSEKGTVTYVGDHFEVTSASEGSQSQVLFCAPASSGTDISATLKLTNADQAQSIPGTDEEDLTGAVDIICKGAGEYGNDIILQLNLRGDVGGERTVNGVGVTITQMSGGAADINVTDIIAAMGDTAYDFIAVPWNDTDSLEKFATELNDTSGRWSYARMLYGHVLTVKRGAAPDALNSLLEFGLTRNDQHCSVLGIEDAFASPLFDVLGALAGLAAANIAIDPARPLQSLTLEGIIGTPLGKGFDLTGRNTLLLNGIAAQLTQSDRSVQLNRLITSYRVNSYGDADISYLDSETLWTLSYIQRYVKAELTSKYPRHKIGDDSDRTYKGQAVVTPKTLQAEVVAIFYRLEELGVVEGVDTWKGDIIVERNATDTERVDMLIPCNLMNGLRVIAEQTQFRK